MPSPPLDAPQAVGHRPQAEFAARVASISMLSLIRRTRGALRRQGVDLIRYNQHSCDFVIEAAFARHAIDTVLDVGANRGQFAASMFDYGFSGRVHSFEPLDSAFKDLAAAAERNARWSSYHFALADEDADGIINIGRNDETSSLRPLVDDSLLAATVVGTQPVVLRRLDGVVTELGIDPARTFLKIDVQGGETAVLGGAGIVLDTLSLVQVETSLRAIYAGESDFMAMIAFFRSRAFAVRGIRPVYFHPETGEIMQVDLIAERIAATSPR